MSFLCRCLVVLALAVPVAAQEIVEAHWGFDGKVVVGRFNVLSVVVRNPGNAPFEGTLVLEKSYAVTRVGGSLVEPCYLSPRSSRLIQFYPFVTQERESWILRWRRHVAAGKRLRVAKAGDPAVVFLDSSELVRAPVKGIGVLPAARFPSTVAATGALAEVVLDHAPDWGPARRDAFLEWLQAGGRLHLLERGGEHPQFTGPLAVLNERAEAFRVGAGEVKKHLVSRSAFDARALGIAPGGDEEPGTQPASMASSILDHLKQQVQPDHNWPLIFLLSFVFMILVGPGHWWVSRRRLDYRFSLLLLVGLIAGFTWLFMKIGARGYGEETRVLTLGYARQVADGRWDVVQYCNVFVTDGDVYQVTDNAEHGMFSTAQQHEAVRATIDNGAKARMSVDIPLFSSRSFVHRGVHPGPSFNLHVKSLPTRNTSGLVLAQSGEPPDPKDILKAWAIRGRWIAPLSVGSDALWRAGAGSSLTLFCRLNDLRNGTEDVWQASSGVSLRYREHLPRTVPPAELAGMLAPRLLADRLRLLQPRGQRRFESREAISVLILAASPESFQVRAAGLGRPSAYVVYHVDVFGQ